MKKIILSLILLVSSFAFAGDTPDEVFMSLEEQTAYMTNKAKEIRKSYWRQGYADVESSTTFVTKAMLGEHFAPREFPYESELTKPQISKIYQCYYRQNCELYLIDVGSSYYGGTGYDAHFVMLYTRSKKSFTLRHTVYAE